MPLPTVRTDIPKNKFNFKKCSNLVRSDCYKIHDYRGHTCAWFSRRWEQTSQTNRRVQEACCQKPARPLEKGEVWTTVQAASCHQVLPYFQKLKKYYSIREICLRSMKPRKGQKALQPVSSASRREGNCEKVPCSLKMVDYGISSAYSENNLFQMLSGPQYAIQKYERFVSFQNSRAKWEN